MTSNPGATVATPAPGDSTRKGHRDPGSARTQLDMTNPARKSPAWSGFSTLVFSRETSGDLSDSRATPIPKASFLSTSNRSTMNKSWCPLKPCLRKPGCRKLSSNWPRPESLTRLRTQGRGSSLSLRLALSPPNSLMAQWSHTPCIASWISPHSSNTVGKKKGRRSCML